MKRISFLVMLASLLALGFLAGCSSDNGDTDVVDTSPVSTFFYTMDNAEVTLELFRSSARYVHQSGDWFVLLVKIGENEFTTIGVVANFDPNTGALTLQPDTQTGYNAPDFPPFTIEVSRDGDNRITSLPAEGIPFSDGRSEFKIVTTPCGRNVDLVPI